MITPISVTHPTPSANGSVAVTLPGGFWEQGICHREAHLHPLTGADEEFLLDYGSALPVQWTTVLLNRCLTQIGTIDRITPDLTAALTVGDREALLLHLRRITLGEHIQAILTCPRQDCAHLMDLDLQISDLLLPAYPDPQPWYDLKLEIEGDCYQVRFRLPTGADQAAVANVQPASQAVDRLLQRCVKQVHRMQERGEPDELPQAWIAPIASQLASAMADRDPQAELLLNLTCPDCGHPFTTLLDTASYLRQELTTHMQGLYQEVHWLAFYYHWSETDILRMTTRKRRRYLDLLTAALSAGGQP